jgi:hypothetical protein
MDIAAPASGRAQNRPTPAFPVRLSPRQITILVVWGVLFWFIAAMFIRLAPAELFSGSAPTALLFAASAPIAWLAVWITRQLASLRHDQIVAGTAIASAAAMLCDGIGLTWSSLYGSLGAVPLAAAAWLLWGVGLILTAAFVAARRRGA